MPIVYSHQGTAGPDTLTGTDHDDVIGAFGGDDIIYALDGIDFLYGGIGNDLLYGGPGNDYLYAGAGDDISYGGIGNDYFEDAAGIDRMYGEDGFDVFVIRSADGDSYDGGNDSDSFYIMLADLVSPGVTIDLSRLWNGGVGYVGTSTIVNVETMPYALYGTNGDDTIIIGSGYGGFTYVMAQGGNDTVTGGSGANNLQGMDGNDSLRGGPSNDYLDGGEGSDSVFGASGDDYLLGGAGDDVINGGDHNDFIDGGLGNDRINGGAGSDTIRTSAGLDTIDGSTGEDSLIVSALGGGAATGGADIDTLAINLSSENPAGITVIDLSGFWTNGKAQIGGLAISGCETLGALNSGTQGADHIILPTPAGSSVRFDGAGGDDLIDGGAGNDQLDGGSGNDTVNGKDGNDSLRGSDGNDVLAGGTGDDVLTGGAGDDVLTGGSGWDRLTGGAGADIFQFGATDFDGSRVLNRDRIMDFNRGEGDRIDLSRVDAIPGGADNAFTFIGDSAFHHVAGELRYNFVEILSVPVTQILGDRDGDGNADMMILLTGGEAVLATDLIL